MSALTPRWAILATSVMMLSVALTPSAVSFHEGEPIVLELTGDEGDAWAVAVRSDDEPTSSNGNELVTMIWTNPPHERSVASAGIVELVPDEEGDFVPGVGALGFIFRGEDQVHVEPFGGIEEPTEPGMLSSLSPTSTDGPMGGMGERRFMEPGEWRYFVVWASGSETSTFRLRGEGYTVEKVIHGEGHALGNDELVNGGGVHAHQTIGLPAGVSSADQGHASAGVTAVQDTGLAMKTSEPLLGAFLEWHSWDACALVCWGVGDAMDATVGLIEDGGFANISIETPTDGHVWNEAGSYWFMPKPMDENSYGQVPGLYTFRVDHLVDVSGPRYQERSTDLGVRFDGEQLVLSLAEVDYTRLEGLEDA